MECGGRNSRPKAEGDARQVAFELNDGTAKMSTTGRHLVFCSYTTREQEMKQIRPLVLKISADIKSRGYGCLLEMIWLDLHRMQPPPMDQQTIAGMLEEGVLSSIAMVSFISPSYFGSEWCRFEWEMARRNDMPIYGVVWKGSDDECFGESSHSFRPTYLDARHPMNWWDTPSRLPANHEEISESLWSQLQKQVELQQDNLNRDSS
jgi:hypothetical protein